MSLKRSSLEPKLLQSVYRNSIGDKFGDLGWTLAYFSGSKIFPQRICGTLFVSARRNFV